MAGEQDLIPMDRLRELARKYNELRTDKQLPQIEINRPGPDIQGFYRRLQGQSQVNQAATGVAVALAEAERARRTQQEAEYLRQNWGSIDLSGVTPQFLQDQGISYSGASGGANPSGKPYQGNYRMTSGYKGGYRKTGGHSGVDWAVPVGTPIYATHDGIIGSSSGGAYGNRLTVSSGSYMTGYAHLSRFAVRPGTRVRRGQLIGYSGATGNVTGPHIHYEVFINGKMTNPAGYY